MQLNRATVVLFLCISSFFVPSQAKCKDKHYCTETKTHGMRSADCYNLNFATFPQCIRSDVEVIDLSYNRLRKLTGDDLKRYTNLKILYLSDNLLTNLDNASFEELDELLVLDLSINGISKLAPIIFQLPSLKKLFLSQNQNINIVEVVEENRPITSPLEGLDISFCDLETLPNLGVMPYLILYNISGNNLLNLSPKDVAGMCNLKKLANNNMTVNFDVPCDCWTVQRWLKERDVKFTSFECRVKETDCEYQISSEDIALFNECKIRYEEERQKTLLLKIGIPVAVGVLLLIIVIIYFLYRRRRQRKSKLKDNIVMKHDVLKLEKENLGLL